MQRWHIRNTVLHNTRIPRNVLNTASLVISKDLSYRHNHETTQDQRWRYFCLSRLGQFIPQPAWGLNEPDVHCRLVIFEIDDVTPSANSTLL